MEHEYLIWSFEHNGWWGPGENGYVVLADLAGRYSLERAQEICLRANFPAIREAIVPLPLHRSEKQRPDGVSEERR